MEVKAMQRSRSLTSLVRLTALALSRNGPAARRYQRERAKGFERRPLTAETPRGRLDGVRELNVTSMQRPQRDWGSRETYVPCLRLAGRWLEEHGFGIHARVFVKIEQGRLIV